MNSSRYLRQMLPRVRTTKNSERISFEKYNYMYIFRGVRESIRYFLKEIFPRDLYPRDRTIRGQYLYNWRYGIMNRFLTYTRPSSAGLSQGNQIFVEALFHIGFTLWFGFGWKFPKRLTRSKFQHKLCTPFIDVARTACDNIMYLTQTQQRSYMVVRYFVRKIINIFSYEMI